MTNGIWSPLYWLTRHLIVLTLLGFVLAGWQWRTDLLFVWVPVATSEPAGLAPQPVPVDADANLPAPAGMVTTAVPVMVAAPLPVVPTPPAEVVIAPEPRDGLDVVDAHALVPPAEPMPPPASAGSGVSVQELPATEGPGYPAQVEPAQVADGISPGQFAPLVDDSMPEAQFAPSHLTVFVEPLDSPVAPELPAMRDDPLPVVPHQPPAPEIGAHSRSLQAARKAFWDGDLEGAEAAYLVYLQRFPEDADAYGELGNLYQSMGRTQAALDAYYEAGVRSRIHGDTEQLDQVINLLLQAGDSRAAELR